MKFKKIASLVKIFRNYYSLHRYEVNSMARKKKNLKKLKKKVVVYYNVNYLHKRTTYKTYQQKEIEREAVGEEMMMIIDKKGIHALKGKTNATILI